MKTSIFAAAALAAAFVPAQAFAQDATAADSAGLRVEAQVMWERLNDPEEDAGINYELGSGVGFSGELGYDVAVSPTVTVGPFASYNLSTVESCDGDLCVASDGGYIVGLQAGLATGEKGLVYAKLGYLNQTITVEGSYTDETGTYQLDDQESGGGYHFALGYEHRFSNPLYGRVELGIGEVSDVYGFDFQRAALGVALGARF